MATQGFKDIPGVHGPIEDPIDRERSRTFTDPIVEVPIMSYKSQLKMAPLATSVMYYAFEGPADFIKSMMDKIRTIKPRRYYHNHFNRVPNIWECAIEDHVCVFEAENQFRRDMAVDAEILEILDRRQIACQAMEGPNHLANCGEIYQLYARTHALWQVKYGDIGTFCTARRVLNKQKNRFIEDRYLARKKPTE